MALINQTQQDYYNNEDFGGYQFTSLKDIVNQFIVSYVGEDKLISKIKRIDVAYHAQRALQELSFDVFKSCKSIETEVQPSLTMPLPQDYVNYTKIYSVDSSGIKHILYPTLSKTSNPKKYQADDNNQFLFNEDGSFIPSGELLRNGVFHGGSNNWILNSRGSSGAGQTTSVIAPGSTTSGDPEVGWFYEKNSIRGYALPQYQAVRQDNVDIRSGEQYTITYTISNYSTGTYNVVIIDENGDYSSTTERTANGTYTETITAGNTAGSNPPSSIYFQTTTDNSATAGLNVVIDDISIVRVDDEETSNTWKNYKSHKPSENNINDYQDYQNDIYWPNEGRRFGLDPQHAQINGSYYIDCDLGKIHFSSNLSGKTVILDYISDSLGTEEEMKVHKFAEEAMYKCIAYAILSTRQNVPEYVVRRYKKERFAETRKAKLRLSNIKLEEITQIFRGKSKQIKH